MVIASNEEFKEALKALATYAGDQRLVALANDEFPAWKSWWDIHHKLVDMLRIYDKHKKEFS